jgi:hypothetical protein
LILAQIDQVIFEQNLKSEAAIIVSDGESGATINAETGGIIPRHR